MSGFKIISSKHFAEKLQDRRVDLSLIASIYTEIAKNPFTKIHKISNGDSAIVFAVDRDRGEIKIITGYPVNKWKDRQWKKRKEMLLY